MKHIEQIRAILPIELQANDDFFTTACTILAGVFDTGNHSFSDFEEDTAQILEALEEINENISDDFTLDFDGCEYRIIADSAIWGIYKEEIKNIVEDCYSDVLNLDKVPGWISLEVDWEQTAKNAFVDGYGHTFASYDGEEIETDNGYWIFRTN